jgi:antitoxin FitA
LRLIGDALSPCGECNRFDRVIASAEEAMASITIRKLDDQLKIRLKHRAIRHGRSMEEEARNILRESLDRDKPETMADIARELFGPEHGFELDIPPRERFRPPPDFADE